MLEKIMKEIAIEVKCNNFACRNRDINRSSYTAGLFTAYCNTLKLIGYEVEDAFCDYDGCDQIAYLALNGEALMINCEWQEAFWKRFQPTPELMNRKYIPMKDALDQARSEYGPLAIAGGKWDYYGGDFLGICDYYDIENMGFCNGGQTRWYYFTSVNGEPAYTLE